MIDLNQVMTFTEAADKWGFANGNTIRKAVERNKFLPAEIRKSGDVWLTTYAAMLRVFGQPRKLDEVITYQEIAELITDAVYLYKNVDLEMNSIFRRIAGAIEKRQTITVVESRNKSERILMVVKTRDDLEAFMNTLKRYLDSLDIKLKKE